MRLFKYLFSTLLSITLLAGCSSESKTSEKSGKEVILGKVELTNGWARPGTMGKTSGAYVTITNGTASVDTLLAIKSEAARKVEIHESVTNDDGTMSMKPAGTQVIPDGTKLKLAPGGLHIMLMELNQDLAIGDSLSLSFEFARVGTKTLYVPVQLQN